MRRYIPATLLIVGLCVNPAHAIATSPYDITWVIKHCFELNPPGRDTQESRQECEGDTYLSVGDYFRVTQVFSQLAILTVVSKSGNRIVSFPALGGKQLRVDNNNPDAPVLGIHTAENPSSAEARQIEWLFMDDANPECTLLKTLTVNVLRHKGSDVMGDGSCVNKLGGLSQHRIPTNDLPAVCEETNLIHWNISTVSGDVRDCENPEDRVSWAIPPEDGQGTGSGGGDSPGQ